MSFVLDAPVVVAWLLDDEDDLRAQTALTRLETEVALVPQIWHIEARSALLGAERRKRLRPAEVDECLHRVKELPVRTDSDPGCRHGIRIGAGAQTVHLRRSLS